METDNMKQMIQELLGEMEERINADRKADWDELKAIMNAFQEKVDSNQANAAKQEEMLAEMNAKMYTIQSELEETMERRMKHLMMPTWNAHQETTEIEQDPGMMQSVKEHQDIPTQDAAVMSVGEPRKQCRV
jgi:predicted nuclease with TOPRIM domain